MDAGKLVDQAIAMAKLLSPLMPVLGAGAEIAEKLDGIFDDLREEATLEQQEAMGLERAEIRRAIVLKAQAESAALRKPG